VGDSASTGDRRTYPGWRVRQNLIGDADAGRWPACLRGVHVLKGALIIESLSTGVVFDDSQLMLRRLARFETTDTTPTQPAIWTILEFSSQMNPDALAELLSGALTSPS
jgi:hypothetical protein